MPLSKTLIFNIKRSVPEVVRILGKSSSSNQEIKQLSDIDNQGGVRLFCPIIFFYPPLLGGTKLDPVNTIRKSLAKALEVYYPLAGRVFERQNKKLVVDCNNKGVMFMEAKANVKLEQLGDSILPPCPYEEKLIFDVPNPKEIIGVPPLYFQVTKFICGGFSLSIMFNHTLTDGHGLMQFLNAIGELAKGASTPSVPPVWQRELLSARSPPRITCIHNEFNQTFPYNKPLKYHEDTFIYTAIFFGPKEIQALGKQLPATSFTKFDVITACLWKCRTIALEPHPDDIVRVSIAMNIHRRKWANVPRGYYGNAIATPAAISKADILCVSPLSYAVNLVQAAKAQMSAEYVQSVADLLVIKGQPTVGLTWNFIVSDLRGLGFDKLDLGWGMPLYGGPPHAYPVASFYNNLRNDKGEEGVLVPICLPSLALKKFQFELMKLTQEPI